MKNLLRVSMGVLALATIAACAEPDAEVDHRQQLIDTREAWGDAIAAGDPERIASFWSEDVVIYPVSEPAVVGIEAVREYMLRNRQELGLRPRLNPLEIVTSESGDLGYVIGTHEWIDADGTATMPGRYLTLWRRDANGEWKCAMEIHSPRPADAEM